MLNKPKQIIYRIEGHKQRHTWYLENEYLNNITSKIRSEIIGNEIGSENPTKKYNTIKKFTNRPKQKANLKSCVQ